MKHFVFVYNGKYLQGFAQLPGVQITLVDRNLKRNMYTF